MVKKAHNFKAKASGKGSTPHRQATLGTPQRRQKTAKVCIDKATGPSFAKTENTHKAHKNQNIKAKNPRNESGLISPEAQKPLPANVHAQSSGVVRQVTVDEAHDGQRLDNFLLCELKGVPKTHVYRVIRSGEVRVNKGRAQAQSRLCSGDEVRIPPVRMPQKTTASTAPAREFPGLYEDAGLLVIHKPAGIAVHGGSGVSFGAIEQLRQARPEQTMLELVHRLDRETSGILAIAKKRSVLTALQDQFRQRETGKTYLALVKGRWLGAAAKHSSQKPSSYMIDVPLHKYLTPEGERRVRVTHKDDPQGKRSISIVNVVREFDAFTLIAVTIKTGRTHQIRVHLVHMGCPIVGDDKYGDFELNRLMAKQHNFSRMFLHAYRLGFTHPQTGEALQLQAPLPLECQVLLEELEHEANHRTKHKTPHKAPL